MGQVRKKAIFIATPGQTEQEYLAQLFMERGWGLSFTQQQFQLQNALTTAAAFNFQPIWMNDGGLLENAVNKLFMQ